MTERGADRASDALSQLASIMTRLRDPNAGCAWDLAQTFETIAPYTIEEAYEVADAITRGDLRDLADELGDLQLQIVFHARMAEEAGAFDLADVIEGISAKMIRRHPHVFDGAAQGAETDWEAVKAAERASRRTTGALAGVALGLPALLRAEKLQRRAARTGFDWPDAEGPRAKVVEELAEVDAASSSNAREEEMGDLLFAIVNWSRHLGIDPEQALRKANAKFERRFGRMEELAESSFTSLPLADKENLWETVKREERRSASPL